MRLLRRAFISVSSRWSKSLLVLLVIVVSMTLVLSSIAIWGAVNKASENAKNQIAANVSIRLDQTKYLNHGESEHPINDKLVEKIKQSKYVKNVNIDLTSYVFGNFKPVEADSGQVMMDEGQQNDNMVMPTNKIQAFESIEKNPNFSSGDKSLVSGVFPSKSTEKYPLLISEEFAQLNNLKLGDKVSVATSFEKGGAQTEYTITGLYRVNNHKQLPFSISLEDDRNTFYSKMDNVKQALLDTGGKSVYYEKIDVELDSGENILPFIDEMKATNEGNSDVISYSSDLDSYQKQTKAIQNVANISQIIIWIASIATILILTLLLTLSLRNRTAELGILLAMGENRMAIIGQMLFESIVIALFAFILSYGTSSFIATQLGNYLVNNEVSSVTKEDENNTENQIIFADPSLQPKEVAPIEKIDVTLTDNGTLIKSYTMGLGIIILSTLIPITWMMRKNPKDIMLRKE